MDLGLLFANIVVWFTAIVLVVVMLITMLSSSAKKTIKLCFFSMMKKPVIFLVTVLRYLIVPLLNLMYHTFFHLWALTFYFVRYWKRWSRPAWTESSSIEVTQKSLSSIKSSYSPNDHR